MSVNEFAKLIVLSIDISIDISFCMQVLV